MKTINIIFISFYYLCKIFLLIHSQLLFSKENSLHTPLFHPLHPYFYACRLRKRGYILYTIVIGTNHIHITITTLQAPFQAHQVIFSPYDSPASKNTHVQACPEESSACFFQPSPHWR